MKTKEDIEKLKENWKSDPCWDIEDTEGFEEHRQELLEFRLKEEDIWAEAKRKHHDKLSSKLCPMSFGSPSPNESYKCVVEKCAWWNDAEDCCVIRALTKK